MTQFEITREDILRWQREGHLAAPDAMRPSTQDEAQILEDAKRVRAALSTIEGAWLLDLIARATILRCPIDTRLPSEAARLYAAERQGQNQVLALLLDYINRADEQDKPDGHPRPHLRPTERRSDADPDAGSDTDAFSLVGLAGADADADRPPAVT